MEAVTFSSHFAFSCKVITIFFTGFALHTKSYHCYLIWPQNLLVAFKCCHWKSWSTAEFDREVQKLMWGIQRTTTLSLAGKGTVVAEKRSNRCTLQVPFPLRLNANSIARYGDWWRPWKEAVFVWSRSPPWICLVGLRSATKNLRKYSRLPGLDLNQASSEYKSRALPLH
jgi:hypothetical protein